MTAEAESHDDKPRAPKPDFLTPTRFDQLDIPPQLQAGLASAGYTRCTPIQAQVLPVSLEGRDVAGQAQTGTGKTAAFLVTVMTRMMTFERKHPDLPVALIVAPTRELALQIHEDAEMLNRETHYRILAVVGGMEYREQAEALKKGVDIVICTPGRIIDYLKQGVFQPKDIRIVVIDEADRLFDLGFTQDMRYLLRKLPHYEKRQSMLFSATLSYRVMELTYEYMNLPEFIAITPDLKTVEGIQQSLFHVGKESKLSLLLGLLQREDWGRVLIFVNTKSGVEWLAWKLQVNGLPAEGITGDIHQRKRLRLMEEFRDGRIKILVATDVASRGIHVEDITHVINYDLPQDPENYVHRIGRTARAGKTGVALSLACEDCVLHLEPIEQMLGNPIPVVWPEDEWFAKDQAGPRPTRKRPREKRDGRGRPAARGPRRASPRRVEAAGPAVEAEAVETEAAETQAPVAARANSQRNGKPVRKGRREMEATGVFKFGLTIAKTEDRAEAEAPVEETAVEEKSAKPAPKKRPRRRRRKKSAAAATPPPAPQAETE
jgi:ATP-dependent RNA helicase RhlB